MKKPISRFEFLQHIIQALSQLEEDDLFTKEAHIELTTATVNLIELTLSMEGSDTGEEETRSYFDLLILKYNIQIDSLEDN